MTQQFNTITDALKWCIDHPDQSCRDGQGRALWFSDLRFYTNMGSEGKIVRYDEFALYPSDLHYFDLATLCPVEPEPTKPTLNNLAALENWDWVVITLPGGSNQYIYKLSRWTAINYSEVKTALSAGWPVEFGRDRT